MNVIIVVLSVIFAWMGGFLLGVHYARSQSKVSYRDPGVKGV